MKIHINFYFTLLCFAFFSHFNSVFAYDSNCWNTLEEDSLILVELYNATNGANWTNNNNWLVPGTAISFWVGIQLNDEGTAVKEINLSDNNLVGPLPAEIGDLINLTHLDLTENQITGEIPMNIGNLENLESLILTNNSLEGTIPNFDLSNLKILNLSRNDLVGTIPDLDLPILEELNLSRNNLDGTIPNFDLPYLEVLDLSINDLEGSIPNFNALPELKVLNIGSNSLDGPIPDFSSLDILEELRMNNLGLTDPIPNFTSLQNLKELYLGNNDFYSTIPDFENLISLERLSITESHLIGEIPNFNLPNLEYLNLWVNHLSGQIPDGLGGLELLTLNLAVNELVGCYPLWVCDIQTFTAYGNLGLPNGGSSGAINQFCDNISSQFGMPCDDQDPTTIGEVIQFDCSCSTQNSFTNFVKGNIFMDTLSNCSYNPDEIPLNNWLITAVSDNATYYVPL